MQLLKVTAAALFCGLVALWCTKPPAQTASMEGKSGNSVSFTWKPNAHRDDFDFELLSAYKNVSFVILPVEDTRDSVWVLGKKALDKLSGDNTVPLTTKQNISQWYTQSIHKALNYFGVSSDKKSGHIILKTELFRFFLNENLSQECETELRIEANTDNDILVWEGTIKGTSALYMKPAGSDGISECISNTVLRTIYNLLTEKSFRDAIMKSSEN